MEYTSLSKKAKPVLFVTALVQALLVGGCLTAALVVLADEIGFAFALYYRYTAVQTLVIAGLWGLCLLWAIVVPPVRFRRYKYKIAHDRIEIIEGLFYIRRTMVPIDRIHQIDIVRGPLDSRFGLAKVTVTTAGATATMRFLELEKAEEICETLNATVTAKLRARQNKGEENV